MLEFTRPPIGPLNARPIAFKEFPNTYFWIWTALNHFYGESPLEEWKEVDGEDDTFLITCSQLSTVAIGIDAHGHTGRFYAREEDLRFAIRYPVLLAQQERATIPPQRPTDTLIGTKALVFDQGALRLCALEHSMLKVRIFGLP